MEELKRLMNDNSNDIDSDVRAAMLRVMGGDKARPLGVAVAGDGSSQRRTVATVKPARWKDRVQWTTTARTYLIGPPGFLRNPTLAELRASPVDTLLAVGFTVEDMYNSGFTKSDIESMAIGQKHFAVKSVATNKAIFNLVHLERYYDIGKAQLLALWDIGLPQLQECEISAAEYRAAGFHAADFATFDDIAATGLSCSEFVNQLGLTRGRLAQLKPTSDICRHPGWSYAEIKSALRCSDANMAAMNINRLAVTPWKR